MDIKLFSKWRPSAILNLRKLPFWSRDGYLHVIPHLLSEIRINRPIWRREIAKKTIFNMASVRHPEFEKFRFLSIFHARNGNLHLRTKFDRNHHNSRLRYGDKAIFKIAAVRHLVFAKIAVLVT